MTKLVSNISEYSGYSEEIYDGYQLTSQYITMDDGCKLAIDIYRPTLHGKLHEEPLPVIWAATQYRRATMKEDGTRTNFVESMDVVFSPCMPTVLKHGYVVAVLDMRGSGASFGQRGMSVNAQEYFDLYDVNEWLASQPFCNGSTGMFGMSYLGQTQWECAIMAPPSLKCIVPNVAPLELPYLFTNGVPNIGWLARIDDLLYEQNVLDPAPRVDEDVDGSMLRAAVEDHKKSPSNLEERMMCPHYDDYVPFWKRKMFLEAYMPNYIYNLNNTNIACYIIDGWKDFFGTDPYEWFNTITVPKRLAVGPWFHDESRYSHAPFEYTVEHLRWYDYWLKGIDNGIMSEPPVLLFNNGTDQWRTYNSFPLEDQQDCEFYFQSEPSGSIESVYDASLSTRPPQVENDSFEYTVDYSVTKRGFDDRYYYTVEGETDYTEFDKKCLTFTTAPFGHDMDFTGFPVIHLWISSDGPDVDFFANLQDVDENGVSTNITEARMRASYRALHNPPFNHMGLPYHRLYKQDQKDLPKNKPVELQWNMWGMSTTIKAGHRLRLTLSNRDKDNWISPEYDPIPHVTVYHDIEHPSRITMPLNPNPHESDIIQHVGKRIVRELFPGEDEMFNNA